MSFKSLADSIMRRVSTDELWQIVEPRNQTDTGPVTGAHRRPYDESADSEESAPYNPETFVDFLVEEFSAFCEQRFSAHPAATVIDIPVPRRHVRGFKRMAYIVNRCHWMECQRGTCTHEVTAENLINRILHTNPLDGMHVTCRTQTLVVQRARQ